MSGSALSAESIARAALAAGNAQKGGKGGASGLPPVHLWNPPDCGPLDIRIARDGTWFYLGTPIGRPELVRLFSTILRREDDGFYLVTPVEKVSITVDDAPFVAVDFAASSSGNGMGVRFFTNVGDEVIAGHDRPMRFTIAPGTGEPSPYVLVRPGLEALIDRKSFYRLVELGVHHLVAGESWFGVWSGEAFFGIIPSHEIAPEMQGNVAPSMRL